MTKGADSMAKWVKQVLQAETAAEIKEAGRRAGGLQYTDLQMCVELLAQGTDDSGTGYILECLTELLFLAKQAGYRYNDFLCFAESPQAAAEAQAQAEKIMLEARKGAAQ